MSLSVLSIQVAKVALFILAGCTLAGCLNAPEFPVEPRIEFISISKDTLLQGTFQEDSLQVIFRFEDGDGDIGRTSTDPGNNVFFIDERTGTLDNSFGLPEFPQDGAANGVEGEVRIRLYSTCCLYTDGEDPCVPNPNQPIDSLQYRIYLMDRAGHKSNEILTNVIYLRCN